MIARLTYYEKRIISRIYCYKRFISITNLHTLIIPKRCVKSYFSLDDQELDNLQKIIKGEKEIKIDRTINLMLGVNDGQDAGQKISLSYSFDSQKKK